MPAGRPEGPGTVTAAGAGTAAAAGAGVATGVAAGAGAGAAARRAGAGQQRGDVIAHDTATGAGARDAGEVDAVLGGEALDQG